MRASVCLAVPLLATSVFTATVCDAQQHADSTNARCRGRVTPDPIDSLQVDKAHPRNFIDIYELTARGDRRPILTHEITPTGRVVCESASAQVDRRSKILIIPDRKKLVADEFEGKFSVTARLVRPGSSRAVEVPGYSTIGQPSQVAPVGVASASTIGGTLTVLRRQWDQLETTLAATRTSADTANAKNRERVARLDSTSGEVRRIAGRLQALRENLVSALDSSTALTSTADSSPAAAARRDSNRVSVTRLRTAIQAHEESLNASQLKLAADSIAQRFATRDAFVPEAIALLRVNRSLLLLVKELTRPENLTLVRAAARVRGSVPVIMTSLAGIADSAWTKLVTVDANATKQSGESLVPYENLITELRAAMRQLLVAARNDSSDTAIRTVLLDAVKDAEVSLERNAAEAGDVLVITLTDSVGVPPADRVMEVRLAVRDFGLLARVADALLLVTLPGDGDVAERLIAAESAAAIDGRITTLDLPVRTRGAPTAGVSYGWVLVPRRDYRVAKVWQAFTAIASWLEPGFGFNAAAASVPMRRIVVAPNQDPTETSLDAAITYTLGGHVSLFNGALVWSAGWTLNDARKRHYTGLGISFLSATEKAKQLFKGLGQ